MRAGVVLVAAVLGVSACGSTTKPGPLKVVPFVLGSKLLERPLHEVLVTPRGGGRGRPLLVFLHGFGATPGETLSAAFVTALSGLGKRAPVVLLPEGSDNSFWHDRAGEPWAQYVLREAIPAALERSGADPHRIAIGGISMGGFGALDIGRLAPRRFCAVGGHSPALYVANPNDHLPDVFDGDADFSRHDLIRIARRGSPYRAPVWVDVGTRDRLRDADTAFARVLRTDGARISFHVWPGSHDGPYWDAHFAQYLRFYADACD